MMKKLTRRQRQQKKKRDAISIKNAEIIIKQNEERSFPLYNHFGIKDPVPMQAWNNMQLRR